MMYAVTLLAVVEYVYVLLSGQLRWSIRSMPQVGFDWVSAIETVWFCSTYATVGSAASFFAAASDRLASKPLSARPKLRTTLPPYPLARPAARLLTAAAPAGAPAGAPRVLSLST